MSHLSTADVSRLTGLSQSAIRKLCGAGKVPAAKIGGVWILEEAVIKTLPVRGRGRPRKARAQNAEKNS